MLARSMLTAATACFAMTTGAIAQMGPHCNPQGRCAVSITVSGSCTDPDNIKVNPDPVAMGRAGQRSIVWRLERGFAFCPANGDAVQFKRGDNDFQFFDGRRTDNDDGDEDAGPADRCRRNFRWKNKNEGHTAGRTYEYLIKFTGPGGEACVKDPFIRNG